MEVTMKTFAMLCFTVLLRVIAGQNSSLPAVQYSSLGCWKDQAVRAVPSLEGQHNLLQNTAYTTRDHPIERCAFATLSFGYFVFVVQNGGWCGSSSEAQVTYDMYGASTKCPSNGTGAAFTNNVYTITPPGMNADVPGITWYHYNRIDFSVSSGSATFFEAKSVCYSYGGTLALAKTNRTRLFLQTLFSSTNANRYWIGLSKDPTVIGSAYLWQDGTSFITSQGNYGPGEPMSLPASAKACTVVDWQQLWYGSRCNWKKRYICQRHSIGSPNMNSVSFCFGPGLAIREFKVAFDACVSGVPVSRWVVAISDEGFVFNVTSTAWYTWGFASTIQRKDNFPGDPTTVTLLWRATFPNATTTTPVVSTTMVSSVVTSSAVTTRTVLKTSAVVHCNSTSVFVPSRNASYSFPQTETGRSSKSKEKCPEGYPMASVSCFSNVTQPSHAYFGTPVVMNCGTNLGSIASQVNPNNATTAYVSVTMATLKTLTSNLSSLSAAHIASAAKALQALGQTDPKKVAIELNTLQDALTTVDQISTSLSSSSSLSNQKSEAAQCQAIVNSMQIFTDRVVLPASTFGLRLVASKTTLQITEPPVHNGYHHSVVFGPPSTTNGTQQQAVTAEIPGALLDQLQAHSRKKRSASSSTTPIRTSFILHNDAALFPSNEKPASVLSINIRGHQSISTTVGINIKFTNTSAKQGNIEIKNGTLKDIVTRTQCSVYHGSNGQWIPTGCSLVAGSSPPKCTCYKLASFSMIVSTKVLPSTFALGIVSYVGCSLSIIGLIITIWIYLAVTELRRRQPTRYLLHICFNLLMVNIIFLFGAGNVSISTACYLSTILLHYFLLVTWFWMSANAFNMYKALAQMGHLGQTASSIPTIISYLLPAVIVIINSTVAIFHEDSKTYRSDDPFFESAYRARNMCWLRYHSLHFGFLLPVGILFLLNLACFISVIYKITCKKSKVQSSGHNRGASEDFAIAISVCIVMGLTWVFGFLMMIADNVTYQSIMAWLFTIFNSTQGLFIFVINCVRQTKVRRLWWTPLVALCRCRPPRHHQMSGTRPSVQLELR